MDGLSRDFPGRIRNPEQGRELAATLAGHDAAMGEIASLSEAELEALAKASPPEFPDHYASRVWTY